MAPRNRSSNASNMTLTAGSTLAAAVSALAAAAAVSPGYLMLTQEEGAEVVNAGFAELVVPNVIDGDKAAVRLTEAGQKAAAELNGTAPAAASPSRSFVIDDNVPVPSVNRAGRNKTIYPFDDLAVGQSFHVAATPDNDNPAKSLASTVSSATARYAEETGETETVTVSVYQTDAEGKRVKGADGHWIKTGEKTETRPKMKNTRVFVVRAVDATDPRGAGARVFRTQ